MKYRIEEIKWGRIFRPIFIPQYKSFLFWHNIREHTGFMNSSYGKAAEKRYGELPSEDKSYVYEYHVAKSIIDDFNDYLKDPNKDSYVRTWKIRDDQIK